MIPSDLYPTSTMTSFPLIRRTRPRTTSPSARVRRDWSYISRSCSYSPSLSSASTPSMGLRRSVRLGLGEGFRFWGAASSGPRVGSSFIFCKSMQAGTSLVVSVAGCLKTGRTAFWTRICVPAHGSSRGDSGGRSGWVSVPPRAGGRDINYPEGPPPRQQDS